MICNEIAFRLWFDLNILWQFTLLSFTGSMTSDKYNLFVRPMSRITRLMLSNDYFIKTQDGHGEAKSKVEQE